MPKHLNLFKFMLITALVPVVLGACVTAVAPRAVSRLDAASQPQFVNVLPLPAAATPDTMRFPGTDYYGVRMEQVEQDLGLIDPRSGKPLFTRVWGFAAGDGRATYPGPTIEARTGRPVKALWESALPEKHLLPVDTTVHCGPSAKQAHSHCRPFVRTVVHLHGGRVPDHSDGYPEAWFSPGFRERGPLFSREVYDYPNDQEAATLWYHDHAMGITRLNVYAGLAGFYLLRDDNEARLQREGLLPDRAFEIPVLIQDRAFLSDGSLFYAQEAGEAERRPEAQERPGEAPKKMPRDPLTGAPTASIEPEFFGDMILVNGKLWPVLEVEPRQYRLRLLNGSNARFYHLWLDSGQTLHQIGGDGGLLPKPVALKDLTLAPAERADVIVDFSDPALKGKAIVLRNDAKTPYPNGDEIDPATTGRIMAFRVTRPRSQVADSRLPSTLRPPIAMPRAQNERTVLLAELEDEFGRVKPMLGTLADGALGWDAPISESPRLGATEVWRIVNATEDAHPVHLHLVQFRVLDRQKFDSKAFEPGKPDTLKLLGRPRPAEPNESGWKDTVMVLPGELVRLAATFDLAGLFVWHCHILEHEDHEMMRPYRVLP
ncbi:MAG: multicopper oxidase domain-containing protein [Pseudomonadota bacterium]|nr:MAG: multicopper oxidase domain-containing protein [Pseudomonadota bacterium]